MPTSSVPPLVDFLKPLIDPRHAQGLRHPLLAILSLACGAMLCGYDSLNAIAQCGREHSPELAQALGFTHPKTPCVATLHRLFKALDVVAFEQALMAWARQVLAAQGQSEALEGAALDGKTLRGSKKQGAAGAHLLSVVSHHLGLTLGQQAVDDKTNEIPAAIPLLKSILVEGMVITADAMHTQREFCQTVVDAQADYVLIAKDNQPTLRADIEAVFTDPVLVAATSTMAELSNQGHGRIEQRTLTASTALLGISDWPGLQQVFRLERRVIENKTGEISTVVEYGLTSLSPEKADADIILPFARGHWTIENRSHWVRDVTYNEDHSQVRSGAIPEIMAALRNVAIGLLRQMGVTNVAAAHRHYVAHPAHVLQLMGLSTG